MFQVAVPPEDPVVSLLADWRGDPSVLVGVVGLALLYLLGVRVRPPGARPPSGWQVSSFLLADLAILVALYSPLHDLSDDYLFSAHMVQHLLLVMLMPTLLLAGTPSWMLRPLLRLRPVRSALRVLTLAPVAYFLFNAPFAGAHLPAFYELTLREHGLHTVEHLVFMATALLAWWPVLGPAPEVPRLQPPVQALYLFLNTFPALLVGAIITDAKVALYPSYAAAARVWGLSAVEDQQTGGLIMWIGGSFYYLLMITIVFFRWAGREQAKEPAAPSDRPPRFVAPPQEQ